MIKTFYQASATGRIFAWCVALGLVVAIESSFAQQNVFHRDSVSTGNWWDGGQNPWYYQTWNNNQDRPDRTWRTANDVFFGHNNNTSMTLNGSDWYYIRTLTFQAAATSARTMNFDNAGIDMRGSGTRKIENLSTGHHVFNVPVSFVDGATEFNPISGNLTFNNTVYFKNNWLEVFGDNGHTLNLFGVMNADSGNGGIAVKGNSIVVATNNNTITGAIWVEKGLFRAGGHTNAIGQSGIVNVGTNATLELDYGAVTLRPATLNLYGTGTNATAGALRKTTTGNTTWPGAITLGADSRIVITSGGMTWGGAVSAGSHTLYVSNNVTVNMPSGASLTGSKTSGDGAIVKSGSGIFTIRQGSGLTGSITLQQGEIRQTADNSSTLPSGGTLTLAGGTRYSSDGAGTRTIAKNVVIEDGMALAVFNSGGITITGNVDLDGGTRVLTNSNAVTISGVISNGGLTKSGAGTMTLSDANTYASNTRIAAGTLELDHQDALQNSTLDMNGSDSGSLSFGSPSSFTLGGLTGSRNINMGAKTLSVGNNDSSTTYSGQLSNGSLTKTGSGTLTLSGVSTYTGDTTVSDGTLQMSGANRINSGSALTVSSGATFDLDGNNTEVATLAGAGDVSLGAGALTTSGNGSTTFSGAISGTGGVTKQGSGTLTLTGANTFDDDLTVSAGTVSIGSGGTSGALDADIVNNASVEFDRSNAYTYDGAISGTGTLTQNGSGALTLSGTHAYSGATTINDGSLLITGSAANSDVTIAAGGTLGGDGPVGDVSVSGTVAPGTSPGDLEVDALTLEEDGEYHWEIGAATGSAGTDWDLITVDSGSGAVTVDATSVNPFVIRVDSMSASPTGWDETEDYSWVIISAGSVAAFDVDKFTIDTTDFDGAIAGEWSLSVDSGDLVLNYTAFPDPMVWFPFTGSTVAPSNVVAHISVTDMDLSAGSVGHGSFNSGDWTGDSGVPYAQGSSGWDALDQASAKYFDFTISADADKIFSIERIQILWRRTGAGPTDVGIRINSTSEVSKALAADTTVSEDFTVTDFDAMTNAFIQIDGWGGGGGDFRIDDIIVSGFVQDGPVITVTGSLTDFGLVGVGDTSAEQSYTVSGVRLRDNLVVTAPTGFEVSTTSGSGFGASVSLSPSSGTVGATTIYVRFAPGTTGAFSDDISHTSDLAITKTQAVEGDGIAAAPTTQATDITFDNVEKDAFDILWTDGNGANRIVVMREGSAVTLLPDNGQEYAGIHADFSVATDQGSGNKVVYSGSGSSVSITGLSTNTTYHARVYEFNGSGSTAHYFTNTATGNPASQTTLDNEPGIGIAASISATTVMGTDPSAGAFVVTNVGGSTLSYDVTTNVSWISSVTPNSGSGLDNSDTQSHTVNYDVTGLTPNTYNGTITITSTGAGQNAATNSPQDLDVTLTVTSIPDPTGQSATADGHELVRLAWTKNASYDVMILHRATNAPAAPTQNTSYNAGDTIGSDGTRVIYKGSDAALEHVVDADQTHHYAFYSVNNDYYSDGVTDNDDTPAFLDDEIVDGIWYTNGVAVSGLSGGQGWTNAWSTSGSGTWTVLTNYSSTTGDVPMMPAMSGYPDTTGNRLQVTGLGANQEAYIFRGIEGISTGSVYVAALVAFRYDQGAGGNDRFVGISLYDGNTEEAFIGRAGGNNVLAIDSTGSAKSEGSYVVSGTEFSGSARTGNVHLVIAKYDFDANRMYAHAYFRTSTVPSIEPDWAITNTPSPAFSSIDRIRLGGGGFSGASLDKMWFDEIRVATSWGGLLNITGPVLDVNPDVLTFNVNITDDPGDQTFTIENINASAMPYTNVITYGAGASGWLTVLPVSSSLSAFESQITTASVTSASLPRGTYVATNTVFAGEAGTNEVVVTLNVTGTVFGVTYDTFDYTATDVLESKNGGGGWTGSWQRNASSPEVFIDSSSIAAFDNYCNDGGNKAQINSWQAGAGGFREAYRDFSAITSGVVYFSSKINMGSSGVNREAGFRLMDGATEKISVGKTVAGDSTGYLSVLYPNNNDYVSTSWQLFASTDYLLVARYDFETRQLRVKGYSTSSMPGTSEPASWDVDVNVDAGTISSLSRFSLYIRNGLATDGIGNSTENPGVVIWDDIRVARSWADLMCGVDFAQTYPVVTNAIFSATVSNEISDGDLLSSNFPVTLYFEDTFGLNSTSSTHPFFIPDFDIANDDGNIVAENIAFTDFGYESAGTVLRASNTMLSAINQDNIKLGSHTVRWSAITSNEAYRLDNSRFEDGTQIQFDVVDDDVGSPVATLLYVGTNYSPGLTNEFVTDGDLAAGGVIDLAVRWDDPSGVWHATNGFENIGSPDGNVQPNWDLLSPSDTDLGFNEPFTNFVGYSGSTSITAVHHRINAVPFGDIELGDWSLTVSAQDNDADRGSWTSGEGSGDHEVQVSDDRAITTNQPLIFSVIDDDTNMPVVVDIWSVSNLVQVLRPLHVTVGDDSKFLSGDTTNRLYRVTDGELASLSSSNPFRLSFGLEDFSGIARTGYDSNMTISIGTVVVSNNVDFSEDESTPAPAEGISTNVWRFESFTYDDIGDLFTAGSNLVSVTAPDADDDRDSDQTTLFNQRFGFLQVRDDDTNGPVMLTLEVDDGAVGDVVLETSFEDSDGWSDQTLGSTPWVLDDGIYGDWNGGGNGSQGTFRSTAFGSGDRARTGEAYLGINAADFAIEFPPVDEPGIVGVWARLSSGTGPRYLQLEKRENDEWIVVGSNAVVSTAFAQFTWTVNEIQNDVTLRVARVGSSDQSIYMDDFTITGARTVWLNTNSVDVSYPDASDESSIYQYRRTAASNTATPPTGMTDGDEVPGAATNFTWDVSTVQGVLTGYVFAVDNDNDRPDDRLMGNPKAFVVRIDRTPPIAVTNIFADEGPDPSSEIEVSWNALDDGGGADINGVYNELSPWQSYLIFYTEEDRDANTNDAFISVESGPSTLGDIAETSATVSNFVFGTTYRIAVAGLDAANNMGPISTSVVVALSGFNITQGVARATSEAEIFWNAAPDREYDLLYVDSTSFTPSLSNDWTLLASGETNALSDTNPISQGTLRFYRAAPKNRWTLDKSPRVATEEVYVAADIKLYEGRNWIALPGVPDDPSVKNVLGTHLPADTSAAGNTTRVHWYERDEHPITTTNTVWLDANAGNPVWRTDPGNNVADTMTLPLDQAFILVMPSGETNQFRFVGRLPVDPQTNVLATGTGGIGALGSLSLVSMRVPYPMHPSEMDLNGVMTAGISMIHADQIWKYNNEGQVAGMPVWRRTDNTWMIGVSPLPESNKYFGPTDGIVIRKRGGSQSSHVAWTNAIPYPSPTRFISP